ncbi:MAG: serine hydrolase domain-containing protein [Vicinamibacterales bacterium]
MIELSSRKALSAALALAALLGFSLSSSSGRPAAVGLRAASPGLQVPADLKPALEEIDKLVSREFAEDKVGSVTVGVVTDTGLAWTRSYGQADMERGVPATADSVYRIGSITKQFTALMLLQLVEKGKVRLSDPVERYFPEVNKVQGRFENAPPITLGQLATMTSGIDREPDDLQTYLVGPVSDWEKVLISALPKTRYRFEPDTRYHYSNIGYAILGAALSRAAGQPFTRYVEERIFAPLGMTSTAWEPNDRIRAFLAKGYAVGRDGKVDADTPAREHQGRGYKVPNGAIYTTVGDLARFVAFELGADVPSVLEKETLQDNYNRVNSSDGELGSGYGVGFQVSRRGAFVVFGHGGSVAGYTAAAYFHRPSRTGVIVLRNAGGDRLNPGGLAMRALELLASAPSKT